jgi:hypothetical protein
MQMHYDCAAMFDYNMHVQNDKVHMAQQKS